MHILIIQVWYKCENIGALGKYKYLDSEPRNLAVILIQACWIY